MTPAQAVAVTEVYRRQTLRLRLTGAAALLAIWRSLTSARDDQIDPFTERATPILAGMQSTAIALTAGYAATLGSTARPDPVAIVIDQDLTDPFVGVWRELSRGASLDDAIAAGADRVRSLADERVIVAQRRTAVQLDDDSRIIGWRRVPKGPTCSFCILVSTQRYHSAEAAGNVGHKNRGREFCDCDVVPILGDNDPGQVINRPVLEAWKQAQGGDAPAYFDSETLTAAPRP